MSGVDTPSPRTGTEAPALTSLLVAAVQANPLRRSTQRVIHVLCLDGPSLVAVSAQQRLLGLLALQL